MKESDKMKKELKKTLKKSIWALHFDAKKIKQKEVQVEVLENNDQKIKLAALLLENGKAKTIVSALISLLNEFDIWEVIKVIICDTTNTNTGAKGGVVIYFKKGVYSQEIRSSTVYWLPASCVRFVIETCMDEILEAKYCHQASIIILLMN